MKIREVAIFVNKNIDKTIKEYPDTQIQILKACLTYQFLYNKYVKLFISINEILEMEPDLGLTRPDNGCLTYILQNTLGMSSLIPTHSILHDAFGRFYIRHGKKRGYIYAKPSKRSNDYDKKNYYKGHVSGLLYCLFNGIRI